MTTALPLPTADGSYLRDLLGKQFTEEQLEAATAPMSPQLVVAGAGSGKTTVMAARVVHAVAFHDVSPSAILGLTFTNKAAGQLAESVRRALRRLNPGVLVDETPTVATYHSYAAGIVRDHALRIGREPVTTLLTEAGRWQLAMRVVRRAQGPFRHIQWQPANLAANLIGLDSEMAEHLASPDDVRAADAAVIASLEDEPSLTNKQRDCLEATKARDELLGLVEAYRAEKQRLELIDYGDQVALAAQIAAESDEVCAIERERFGLVLLDEYQDTGIAQRLLLARLFGDGHAVTAVGDPNQGIYGWRGASVGNLLRFREHFDGRDEVRPLMTSFRCGGRILAAANAIAAPLVESPGAKRRPAVSVPELAAAEGREDDGEIVVGLLDRIDAEADWVADQIDRAVSIDGFTPGQVAVLCRRRTDFALLHRALVSRDIPVEVVGLGGLLEMPEVADLVAVLRVLVEPTANPALLRILTGPRWRIGPRDLAALGHRASRLAWTRGDDDVPLGDVDAALRKAAEGVDAVDVASLLDVIDLLKPDDTDLSPEALSRLLELRDELDLLRALVGQPIVEVAAEVIRRTGLDVELETETSRVAAARTANLAAFLDHAAQFTGIEGESDLASFLGWLDAAVAAESGLDVGGVSEADTVKLLTVHKAKGLEWDVVAIPGLTSSVFPSTRSRSRWTTAAAVLPFPVRGDADDLPPAPPLTAKGLDAFKAACSSDDSDEERRLGYVAVTRAATRVIASGYWWGATRQKPMGPSELLTELHDLASSGLGVVDVWVESVDDDTNPMAELTADDVAWPPSYDVDALARRLRAAELVGSVGDRVDPAAEATLSAADRARLARWDDEADLLLDELRRQRVAVREVPLPRRLTASQVVVLAHDPDELAQMLARPVPVRPQPQARRGSRFHAWVEGLYGATPLLEPDDLPGAGDADVGDEELEALQAKFLADGWGDRRPVAVEQPFELVVGGRLVRGRIDAVYPRDDGGFDVVDYKTGSVPRDFAAASLQLSVYRLAWAELHDVDPGLVSAGFLYVKTGALKRPDKLLSRDELAALFTG
ncbi:MAG TPA: UvrD-helicase domain-containing protein [Mycobacteriales bacterium]|jgi:DNA helicase-2/ATP-dependent DNA helicase PcrA|nr:UvrD-helicase domain-containing protein [Mycobacteriales bacterium]